MNDWIEWVQADRLRVFKLVREMDRRGSFMASLASALTVADSRNTERLLTTWQDVFQTMLPMTEEEVA